MLARAVRPHRDAALELGLKRLDGPYAAERWTVDFALWASREQQIASGIEIGNTATQAWTTHACTVVIGVHVQIEWRTIVACSTECRIDGSV